MSEPIEEQWRPYARLVPFEAIRKAIAVPQSVMEEAPHFILPSVGMGTDGQIVQSVILLTETYICEVRLGQNRTDFDVSIAATIANYRVATCTHEITREEPAPEPSGEKKVVKTIYDSATITFKHTIGLTTEFTFVGDGRDEWVKRVLQAVPIEILQKSLRATS